VKEILSMVNDEIKMSGYKDKLNLGVVLTGGGAQLKDLSNLVEFTLGCEAKVGMPDPHLGIGLVEEVRSPMYATCIGLVLKGFEDMEPSQNENTKKSKKGDLPDNTRKGFKGLLVGLMGWLKEEDGDFKKQ
jgi:cell division protein FtsA